MRGPAVVLVLDPSHPMVRAMAPGVAAAYERWPAQYHASTVVVMARGGVDSYAVAGGQVEERAPVAND